MDRLMTTHLYDDEGAGEISPRPKISRQSSSVDRLSCALKNPKLIFTITDVWSNLTHLNQRAKSPIHAEPAYRTFSGS